MANAKCCYSLYTSWVIRMLKYFLIFGFFCQLWVQIVDGDIEDSTRSDLYEYVVDFLTFCSDQDLVWKYSEWVLQKNEEVCDWCTCFFTFLR